MITDRLQMIGGEPQESAILLRGLDQMLIRRAAAIEAELREISQVRQRIESLLPPAADGTVGTPSSPGIGGASLGQMI